MAIIVKQKENMDNKTRMEGLVRDECELEDWYCGEDNKGEVHVRKKEYLPNTGV